MDRTCYCCDSPSVGRGDHVPSKQFFPKGSFATIKPIIVPSCIAHNQSQSKADEYLKFVMISSTGFPGGDLLKTTADSIARLIKMGSRNLDRYGIEISKEEITSYGSAPVDEALLGEGLTKIARGLYYHHYNGRKKLIGEVTATQLFLGIRDDAPSERQQAYAGYKILVHDHLSSHEVHGTHPEIFKYQVIESPSRIFVHMIFYGTNITSVMKIQ